MTGPVLPSLRTPQFHNSGTSPIRDLSDAPRSLLGTLSGQKPRYYCERSRFTLLSPEQDGKRTLYHAPCKSNRCPHCGRANMYRKRNRVNDRLKLDRETGLNDKTASEFVTTTVRPGALTEAQAYAWIKKGMAYAVQSVRRERKYNKRYRRAQWDGCELEYVNDVDIQPGTRMPHVHALYRVRFPGVALRGGVEKLRERYSKRMAKELHYYLNNWLRRRLSEWNAALALLVQVVALDNGAWAMLAAAAKCGAEEWPSLRWKEGLPYPYQGEDSIAYVHFSKARSTENCVMYMALHNGKIWTDGREYPRNYRRFATSRGFLAKLEKSESGYEFLRTPLSLAVQKLSGQNVPLDFSQSERGHDGTLLSVAVASGQAYHCWETEGGVPRQADTANGYRLDFALGRSKGEVDRSGGSATVPLMQAALEKMLALEDYWASNADQDGGSTLPGPVHPKTGLPSGTRFKPGVTFGAWQAGQVSASVAALVPGVYRWQDDPFADGPQFDPVHEQQCDEALSLCRADGRSFADALETVKTLYAFTASRQKETPHPRR